ncbi:hypothetical protein B6D17_07540 [Gilliamella apis]|uniref:hypothetical protein n=2 Tax=Gilliamella apis TaxID=1970738 RepID=UPI000A35768D|nr:hypothetical protein [Gilliamella apis]OTQ70813.1 hypothetical protein B6D17_07540 [Gilliamella apis]
MEKASFFKLSMIGSTIYLFLSFLLIIFYCSCLPDTGFSQELFWDYLNSVSLLDSFFLYQFFEVLWLFGVLTLFLHFNNIYLVNLHNVLLLMLLILMYSGITFCIWCFIDTYIDELSSLSQRILCYSAFIFLHYIFYSLLLYYLIELSKKFFLKHRQAFRLTPQNSSLIHAILFLAFICPIFFSGFEIIEVFYDLSVNPNLKFTFVLFILFCMRVSKKNFMISFDEIQYARLFKSVFISSVLLLLNVLIFLLLRGKSRSFYFDYSSLILDYIKLFFLVVFFLLLTYLIFNKVTKHYFLKFDNKK